MTSRPSPAGLFAGAALLGLAAVVALDAARLPAAGGYGVGPGAAPAVVAGGLALLGLANGALAFRGEPAPDGPVDLRALGLVAAGLAVLTASVALEGGFVLGAAALFAATAAAMRGRGRLADLGLGLALALGAFLLFTKLLGLGLPSGPLERLL